MAQICINKKNEMKKIHLLIPFTILLSNCEKKKAIEPERNTAYDAVNVLNDNSGFDSVYNYISLAQASEVYKFTDMTLESNDNLNFVFYSRYPTQQSTQSKVIRGTKNLATNQLIPLPAKAAINYQPEYSQPAGNNRESHGFGVFRPFTNYFTYTYYFNQYTTSGYYKTRTEFRDDLVATVSDTSSFRDAIASMSFMFPVMNPYSSNTYAIGAFGYGVPNPNYLFKVCNFSKVSYPIANSKTILATQLEPRTFPNTLSYIFEWSEDELIVSSTPNTGAFIKTKITSINLSGLVGTIAEDLNMRMNYNADGSTMGLLLTQNKTKKYWSCSFNANANTLTKVLDNATLDYAGTESDIDLDELGNVYYSGVAGNGANTNGISIYKKTNTGNTLVGSDNFLKFGTIIGLRSLKGKVFFVVSGKKSGTDLRQISIIKEN
jgi:hypothetical protein